MKNTAVERIIKTTKRNIYKDREFDKFLFYENVKLIEEYCKRKLQEHPEFTSEDLKDFVLEELSDYNDKYSSTANITGKLYEIEAFDELIENPKLLKKEYEIVKKRGKLQERDIVRYDSNLERTCKQIINDTLLSIEEDKKFLTKDVVDFVEKYKKASPKEKQKLETQVKDLEGFKKILPLISGEEIEKVKASLKTVKEKEEDSTKDIQIQTMEIIYSFFDEFGIIESRIKRQNNSMLKNTGLDLSYEFSTNKYEADNIGLKELFTEKFLRTQSLEDILTYSAFWQNAFAKECYNINQGLFAIDTLNLWEDIKNGKEININEEQSQAIIKKEECLNLLVENLISGVREKTESEEVTKEDVERGYKKINTRNLVEAYNKQEGENYKKIFDEILPESDNNLFNDIKIKRILFIQTNNIYRIKDKIIAYKVRSLFRTKKSKNWGIIENEIKRNGKRVNAIESNQKRLVVAVDYEGINMPLRLHIDRDLLSDLIRLYNGTTIIPLYEGSDDFFINGELLTTKALMPISKEHKKMINKALKDNNIEIHRKNLLEHLQFLSNNDKYPKHLKQEKRSKKGIIFERPPRKYIDLKTGGKYYKNKNKLIPVEEREQSGISK